MTHLPTYLHESQPGVRRSQSVYKFSLSLDGGSTYIHVMHTAASACTCTEFVCAMSVCLYRERETHLHVHAEWGKEEEEGRKGIMSGG
jgi:hypothetical protein